MCACKFFYRSPYLPVIRTVTLPANSLSAFAALILGVSGASAALLDSLVVPARHRTAGFIAPWPVSSERSVFADFLDQALPVAGNKADPDNAAIGFFRTPQLSPNDAGVILYVGLCAEEAPAGSQYRIPLYSGSVESFQLGLAKAQPAPQTVGDIGEIYADDAPPVPMAYIVYRLDFGTRNEDVALFATPTLTPEPVTTGSASDSPMVIGTKFAWEEIRFTNMPSLDDRDVDWQTEHSSTGRIVPEPASTALIVAGLLGLASRRRRRG